MAAVITPRTTTRRSMKAGRVILRHMAAVETNSVLSRTPCGCSFIPRNVQCGGGQEPILQTGHLLTQRGTLQNLLRKAGEATPIL